MHYLKKQIKIPSDMVVGSTVGVVGEGDSTQTIIGIDRDGEGMVTAIRLSGGWREPLCKIFLCRAGKTLVESYRDLTSRIDVSVGECDTCGSKFPDSCVYESNPDIPGSMMCRDCWEGVEVGLKAKGGV